MMQALAVCFELLRVALPLPWHSRQVSMPGISTSLEDSDVDATIAVTDRVGNVLAVDATAR